jgi:TrpR-related protein YerC/YecD
MQVSPKNLDFKVSRTIKNQLLTVLCDLRNHNDLASFFEDFFTPTEQVVLMKRLAIATMLKDGRSYEEIKKILNVSSATISFVAEHLQNKGIQIALSKIDDDEWAEKFISQLPKFFTRKKNS